MNLTPRDVGKLNRFKEELKVSNRNKVFKTTPKNFDFQEVVLRNKGRNNLNQLNATTEDAYRLQQSTLTTNQLFDLTPKTQRFDITLNPT